MLSYFPHHSSLLLHRHVSPICCVSSSLHHPDHNPPEKHTTSLQTDDTLALRRHNSKSSSLSFLHHRQKTLNQKIPSELHQEPYVITEAENNEENRILELSLVGKRIPQFPGSIYVQSPSDADATSSLPPLRTIFGSENVDESEMIAKALEIRRRVTREIFKEVMKKKGRFGINYITNLTNLLDVFVDHVMIEAAALKRMPEFSESSFNLRAKTVIEDSNIVPLIRLVRTKQNAHKVFDYRSVRNYYQPIRSVYAVDHIKIYIYFISNLVISSFGFRLTFGSG